jgi:hypothetical protein
MAAIGRPSGERLEVDCLVYVYDFSKSVGVLNSEDIRHGSFSSDNITRYSKDYSIINHSKTVSPLPPIYKQSGKLTLLEY